MPQRAWSRKRERQYEHIKEGLQSRGTKESKAEEIAARISSGRRGGLRSHSGSQGRTRDQLYEEARRKNVPGRSSMNKAELARAVGRS
jgi:hypothetical protein